VTATKKCPLCRANAWPIKLYGVHHCPNCKTQFRLTASHIEPYVSVRQVRRQPKASRDNVVINGQVMCACCNRPFPLNDCVDGRIDGDGTRLIRVQIGWTFDSGDLVPAFQQRAIPRVVRGMICSECFVSYHGREVFTADARLKRKQSLPYERAESQQSDIRGGRLYAPPLDDNPTWAHTGDCTWLLSQAGMVAVQHPASRMERDEDRMDDLEIIDASRYHGPLSVLRPVLGKRPFTCVQFDNRLGRSPNPITRGHSRRERVGRGLTLADTLSAAVRHAIAIGDASAASRYARLAARHPAARRHTVE